MKKITFLFNSRGLSLGLFIAAVALGAFGVAFVTTSVQMSSLAEFSKTWSETPARVTFLDLKTPNGKPEPVIEYVFWVKNREIKGRRLFLAAGPIEDASKGKDTLSFAYRDPEGKRVERQFFVGAETKAYYNPHLPEECVLIRLVLRDLKPYFFWGAGLFLIAVCLLVRSFYEE